MLLLSRWLLSLLATAALCGLLWVFGPLLPPLEPVTARVLGVQSLLLLWAVPNALIDWRRRAREAALRGGLVPGGEARAEREAVGATLARALGSLGRAERREVLLERPWYAIIGPPGAGKTTALLNAGLRFPLAGRVGEAAVGGEGGTRLCDWWFTERAVLIDTAGRYTTQDSDAAVDRAGWEAFLDLLRRTRPRQGLNGVIVAVPLPDLVSAEARAAHAAAVRARLDELEARLGLRLPCYALFTKADLLAGFTEFFEPLGPEERAQVWGATFPLPGRGAAPDWPSRAVAGLRDLVARLQGRLVARLQAERRPERRGAILGFPTQLASLEAPLSGFVSAAFGGARPALLRGVFLASGTQEGTPIDRLTGAMARAFGIEPARAAALRPERGRSFFLQDLLGGVVLGEAMLVREAPGAARRRAALRLAGLGVVGLAVLGAAGGLLLAARGGEAEVASVARALDAYRQDAAGARLDPVADGDLRPVAALLDRAAALSDRALSDRTLPGWAGLAPAALGLGQGGKLAAGAAAAYRDALSFGLLPRLVWRLESRIRGDGGRAEVLYEEVRLYLMLGGEGPLDPAAVRDWMVADWDAAYPGDADASLRADLRRHLDALLREPLPRVPLDGALVARARAEIARVPLAERVYATIAPSAAARALPPWRPIDALHPAGAELFTRASGLPMTDGVPGLFTPRGFREVLLPAVDGGVRLVAAESWVLGRRAELAPDGRRDLEAAVTGLYLDEYGRRWDAMLADLQVAPINSLPQAARDLFVLSSAESPMRAVLLALASQLALAPPPAGARINARYAPLLALAADPAPLDAALRVMADVQQQLAKLAALPVGTPIPAGGEDIAARLRQTALAAPQPLARWLLSVAATAEALRTGNARRQAAIAWNAPGGPAQQCAEAVSHPPFAATGTPLPLDAFARVFAPGGVLDGFFNTQLRAYVDTASRPWRPQPASTGATPARCRRPRWRSSSARPPSATPSSRAGAPPPRCSSRSSPRGGAAGPWTCRASPWGGRGRARGRSRRPQ